MNYLDLCEYGNYIYRLECLKNKIPIYSNEKSVKVKFNDWDMIGEAFSLLKNEMHKKNEEANKVVIDQEFTLTSPDSSGISNFTHKWWTKDKESLEKEGFES